MILKPNKKSIGIFIIVGFSSLLGIIIHVLTDTFINKEDELVVMYFDESVKGLSVGSSVVLKGVEIGKVVKIELLSSLSNMNFSIPVYARLFSNQNISKQSLNFYKRRDTLNEFIDKGLRARLISQNFLTGQLMIELEILPNTPISLKHDVASPILEIPTTLSPIGALSRDIQTLPFRDIMDRFNAILGQLEHALPRILPALESVSQKTDAFISRSTPDMTDAVGRLNTTLYDVGDAAKSLRNMADYLERHPEALLKGKKGN